MDVNAVPARSVTDPSALKPSTSRLFGVGGQALRVLGKTGRNAQLWEEQHN